MTRIGLVGAGPWAGMFHAPMISGGPGTELAAVWARRPEAARKVVEEYGGVVAASFDDLLERCDAVAFAVPPDVQAELAPRAAEAGKHLLLEKPLAFTLDGAERIARAVSEAGVTSLLMIRSRYDPAVLRLLERAAEAVPRGLIASWIADGALPGSPFATPWRIERGALLDLGPHVLDLVEALLGPVTGLQAAGDPLRWVAITTTHEGGAVGQVSLSITTPGAADGLRLEVVTESGSVVLGDGGEDGGEDDDRTEAAVQRRIMTEFTACIAEGRDHPLGAQRGLLLQQLLTRAEESMQERPAPVDR